MQHTLWEGDTAYGHYQVVSTPYNGRPARVLYSGSRQAAQSGIPLDDNPNLLFDYNQRFFELASSLIPKHVLIIGGGAFTLPTALLHALPESTIDVVELDPGLTDIAMQFFDLPLNERLHIFNTDGREYLRSHAETYDMIVVDAFTHTTIPHDMKTIQAFEAYASHLATDGILAVNAISGYYGSHARVLQELCAAALHSFDQVNTFLAGEGYSLWLPQNFVFVAQKNTGRTVEGYIHAQAVLPPEFQADMALKD